MPDIAIALDALTDPRALLLGASAVAFLWLAIAGPRLFLPRQTGETPVRFPRDDMSRWPRHGRHDPGIESERIEEMLGSQLRHAAGGGNPITALPPPMQVALLILGAGASRPDGIDEPTGTLLDWANRTRLGPPPTGMPSKGILEAIDKASEGHSWWECVAVELMDRARTAGSWLTPHDLRFLAGEEPALLAALSAGPGDTVSPDGAGILSHHRAERLTGAGVLSPYTEAAVAPLSARLLAADRP